MEALAARAAARSRVCQILYTVGACLVGALLLARLYEWQVVQHSDLVRRATLEHVSRETIPAERGTIYDATGNPLVANVSYDLVFAVPSELDNPPLEAEKLAPILGIPADTIMQRFQLSENWVALARKQPPAVSAQIRSLQSNARQQRGQELRGIGLQPESKRVYPAGTLASQVLGFTSYDGAGQYGIENQYNDLLAGTPGRLTVERDVSGQELDLGDRTMDPPQNGANLYLTIDQTMQFIVEQQLAAAVQQHQATGGTVIVMNPRTGAIMAMASVPTFDPNRFETADAKLFVNPAISTPFEPGSTFKLITMSAGIELRAVTPDTTMVDRGSELIGGQTIWDWDRKAHGTVTMVDVLARSLNLGAAWVGRRVGASDFYRYVQNFGFGQRTGVDLQGEAAGVVRTPSGDSWYPIDLSTNSFGQGLTATPLQLTTAVAAIANGGAMMRPYVVQRTIKGGTTNETVPVIAGHPISPETARTMTDMMVKVIQKGEGNAAAIPGYSVAGKTGTASIAEHGVYLQDATVASFVGFVPAQSPAFVMYIKIDRPKDTPWGSETAAPLFSSISKELLLYLHVAPTEPVPTPTPMPTPRATSASPNAQIAAGADSSGTGAASESVRPTASAPARPTPGALRPFEGDTRRGQAARPPATVVPALKAPVRERPPPVATAKGR